MAETIDAGVNADNTLQITGKSQTLMNVSVCLVQCEMSVALPVITGNARAVNRDGDRDRVSPTGVRDILPANPLNRYSDTPTVAYAFPLWKSWTMIVLDISFSLLPEFNWTILLFFFYLVTTAHQICHRGKRNIQGVCRGAAENTRYLGGKTAAGILCCSMQHQSVNLNLYSTSHTSNAGQGKVQSLVSMHSLCHYV